MKRDWALALTSPTTWVDTESCKLTQAISKEKLRQNDPSDQGRQLVEWEATAARRLKPDRTLCPSITFTLRNANSW
jgi:hypothetical protein